jgi:hypothetical protein
MASIFFIVFFVAHGSMIAFGSSPNVQSVVSTHTPSPLHNSTHQAERWRSRHLATAMPQGFMK